jgi:hypothetical protein
VVADRRGSAPTLAVLAAASLLACGAASAQEHGSLTGEARDARIAELRQLGNRGGEGPMPVKKAALDEALAQTDYAGLRALMAFETQDEAARILAWTRNAVFGGESFPLAYFYSVDLWTLAESYEARAAEGGEEAAADLEIARSSKLLSTMMAVYARTVVYVDSRRCEDRSVRHQVLADLDTHLAPQWAFIESLPNELAERVTANARGLEERTAPVREPDLWLCASGYGFSTAQIRAGQDSTGSETARRPLEDLTAPGGDTAREMGRSDLLVDDGLWWAHVGLARIAAMRHRPSGATNVSGR